MTAHTPWSVSRLDFRMVVDAQDLVVAVIRLPLHEARDAASLIAAAPDLLAALKEARKSIAVTADILGCEAALMPMMDAAIARAEGRTS